LLSWNSTGGWGFSIGSLGVLLACILWGLDNNLTRNISAKDPVVIVMIKGIGAGSFSLILSICLHNSFPGITVIIGAMLLGFFSYGISIVLFIKAMRALGASRTSAFYSAAPFLGALFSFVLIHEVPNILFYISLPIMIIGTILLIGEKHDHKHLHALVEHEHRHTHDDGHHTVDEQYHVHAPSVDPALDHSHLHIHEETEHSHPHTPDIHHRHLHKP